MSDVRSPPASPAFPAPAPAAASEIPTQPTVVAAVPSLLPRLPAVRGRLATDAPLGPRSWFRVGGVAQVLFTPADEADLAAFLAGCPAEVPLTVIGAGSNLLIRDGGVPGVVIRLGRGLADVGIDGMVVEAGAAALDLTVAQEACTAGIGGLAFLSGIPGTLGGAVRMNAGAYGREVADVLRWAQTVDRTGTLRRWGREELTFAYRHCALPEDQIITRVAVQGEPAAPAAIATIMETIASQREASQPLRTRTGGSTFANPPGMKAWELIDQAGCRGLQRGGAQISEKHCNFLLNTGTASADDLERLGETVRRRVWENSGVILRWEIRRIGVPLPGVALPETLESLLARSAGETPADPACRSGVQAMATTTGGPFS